jgi:hypothetical protein
MSIIEYRDYSIDLEDNNKGPYVSVFYKFYELFRNILEEEFYECKREGSIVVLEKLQNKLETDYNEDFQLSKQFYANPCSKMYDKEMRKTMFEHFQKRHNCWILCREQMTNSIGKGAGVRKKKVFVERLKHICNTIFVDEDAEYLSVTKFGRGMWSKDIIEKFSKKDRDYIVNFIAKECGAFDY